MEMINERRTIDAAVWNEGMDWETYMELLETLMAEGKTTGTQQTPERLEHARLNLQRMKRINQQFEPDPATVAEIQKKDNDIRFLFIVEGWCGDAAQIVPALFKVVKMAGREARFILRDEHPEVMDMFLTNGSRSIPAVVAIGREGEVLSNHWGPRPALLADLVSNWKQEMSKDDWHKLLHTWYAKDKANTLQGDFTAWLQTF